LVQDTRYLGSAPRVGGKDQLLFEYIDVYMLHVVGGVDGEYGGYEGGTGSRKSASTLSGQALDRLLDLGFYIMQ
jgi:hypothetical protein